MIFLFTAFYILRLTHIHTFCPFMCESILSVLRGISLVLHIALFHFIGLLSCLVLLCKISNVLSQFFVYLLFLFLQQNHNFWSVLLWGRCLLCYGIQHLSLLQTEFILVSINLYFLFSLFCLSSSLMWTSSYFFSSSFLILEKRFQVKGFCQLWSLFVFSLSLCSCLTFSLLFSFTTAAYVFPLF